jgi:sarcosine oxidase, subunit gamma
MAQPLRRSFVHRKLAAAGARFAPFRDALVATDFGQPEAERQALRRLALVDLSPLPRAGFKGPGAPEWLEGEGLTLPPPNQALLAEGGELVVRLAPREVLLLGPPEPREEPSLPDRLQAAWAAASASPRGYPVPRQDSHFWFLVAGEQAPAMFAKLCGVDLRPHKFAELAVAQTQAMRITVIIIRDRAEPPVFHLLADSASAEYAWDCLLDAMAEFDGRPAGLGALG